MEHDGFLSAYKGLKVGPRGSRCGDDWGMKRLLQSLNVCVGARMLWQSKLMRELTPRRGKKAGIPSEDSCMIGVLRVVTLHACR